MGGGLSAEVASLLISEDGNLYVGGQFSRAGSASVAASAIARWDGSAWSAMGDDFYYPVFALAERGDTLYAASSDRVARWDGAQWVPLGGGMNGDVLALDFSAAGDLYAAGRFTQAGGTLVNYVGRWDGADWNALNGGLYGAYGEALTVSGEAVYVGGRFYTAGTKPMDGGMPSANFAEWVIPASLPIEGEEGPSAALTLRNYPNPFREETMIEYSLPTSSHVSVKIYDVLGREIATLAEGMQAAGAHRLSFAGGWLPNGIYYCRLTAETQSVTSKLILLK